MSGTPVAGTADPVVGRAPTIDAALVEQLVAAQFPQWAGLAVRPVEFDGWDNRTFRLGDRLSVRLPSAPGYVPQVEKEHRWLPALAPLLPLPIPEPIGLGRASASFPRPWSVYGWIDGRVADRAPISDRIRFATDLADFLLALSDIDATDGPEPGEHNFFRGGPLEVYDDETRRAVSALGDRVDGRAALRVWDAALDATSTARPVWFHGDVSAGNLLVRNGVLSAVIDFGTCGVGDPSCDLAITLTMFDGGARDVFRRAIARDSGTWARGRGWTIWKALIVAAGHAGTNSPGIGRSLRVIDDVIEDFTLFAD